MCKFSNLLALSEEASLKSIPIEIVPLKGPLLKLASMKIILGVATNDSEASANTHLETIGVSGFFKYIIGYDSGFGSKPDPDQCLAFCSKAGIQPDECVMVGDSLHDMQAGKLAGMKTVGVLSGLADKTSLEPAADVILPDVSYLPELITLIQPPL
jgi:phosphoglycolate phosphatase